MKIGSIFTNQKENQRVWFEKKEEEEPRKFKNNRSTRQVMLTAFWYCRSLVYLKFGPKTLKEKQNFAQDTFLTL